MGVGVSVGESGSWVTAFSGEKSGRPARSDRSGVMVLGMGGIGLGVRGHRRMSFWTLYGVAVLVDGFFLGDGVDALVLLFDVEF